MENETNIILIILAGCSVMFILILAILLFVVTYNRRIREKETEYKMILKNKEVDLLKAVFKAQENEREILAGNLHDEVGPLLSALKLRISLYIRHINIGEFNTSKLEEEEKNIDNIILNVRTVSHNLTPQIVLKFGLIEALRIHLSNYNNPNYFLQSKLNSSSLEKHVQTNVYRIALELINNIVKYDKPTKLQVEFHNKVGFIIVEFTHNGKGISQEEFEKYSDESKGLGLHSVKSRTILINGTLSFHAEAGKNPLIRLSIPKEEHGKD